MGTGDDAHGLPLAGEWDHLGDLDPLASFVPILPTEVVELIAVGLSKRHSSRGDRMVSCLPVRWKTVRVFPVHLLFVCDLSDIVFPGIPQLLMECVCAGLQVLLDIADFETWHECRSIPRRRS